MNSRIEEIKRCFNYSRIDKYSCDYHKMPPSSQAYIQWLICVAEAAEDVVEDVNISLLTLHEINKIIKLREALEGDGE